MYLFQGNCIHRSREQVKQATCFNFPEMSWLLAEHEDRGLRTGGHIIKPPTGCWINLITLFLFSFSVVPMYIYLENLGNWLNNVRSALCLAMGSDRIIAKQGNNLLGLSLNWYVVTPIVYVYHFYQSQFTLFWDIFGEESCRFKKSLEFFTFWHLKEVQWMGIWYPICKNS